MKADYINPFLNSTLNVFHTLVGERPTYGKPAILERFGSHRWDISGVIGIVGAAEGVVALRLTQSIVERLLETSGLAWNSEDDLSELVSSMVGEIINVIAGNTVGIIDQYDLNITVPMVVQGLNHSISWPQNAPVITVPFRISKGVFEVNFSLKEIPLYKPKA